MRASEGRCGFDAPVITSPTAGGKGEPRIVLNCLNRRPAIVQKRLYHEVLDLDSLCPENDPAKRSQSDPQKRSHSRVGTMVTYPADVGNGEPGVGGGGRVGVPWTSGSEGSVATRTGRRPRYTHARRVFFERAVTSESSWRADELLQLDGPGVACVLKHTTRGGAKTEGRVVDRRRDLVVSIVFLRDQPADCQPLTRITMSTRG